MPHDGELSEKTLIALRKIMRAVDIHSRRLVQSHQLTGPQLIVLRELDRHESLPIGELARLVSLGNATTTGIVDRLEQRGLVARSRAGRDRRNVMVGCTDSGRQLLQSAPPLLQEQFIRRLAGLHDWERAQILSSLERVALMMDAEHLDAAPVLAHYPLDTPESSLFSPAGKCADKTSSASGGDSGQWHVREARQPEDFPAGVTVETLAGHLHEWLKPYNDTVEDIARGIADALTPSGQLAGFVLLMQREDEVGGALVMLSTGMKGYVPENLLLFVAVSPELRGKGLGRRLVERAVELAGGNVKLHVEYDNPARRLYERVGFISKYAEMRYSHEPTGH